jgi:2-phosphosulfolactate phosphatase
MSQPTVLIECFETGFRGPWQDWAVVTIDVIRATTTILTGIAQGRRCFAAESLDAAVCLAERLPNPLLVGELGGNMPYGFHLTNSPAQLAERTDTHRPMLLLSTSGTALIGAAREAQVVYAACLRNYTAQAELLVGRYERVALVGAGSRREFRDEDQLCCARIGSALVAAGYEPLGCTAEIIERWRGAPVETILGGNSARYLTDTGQQQDLEFILEHVDDLDCVAQLEGDELVGLALRAAVEPTGHSLQRSPAGPVGCTRTSNGDAGDLSRSVDGDPLALALGRTPVASSLPAFGKEDAT